MAISDILNHHTTLLEKSIPDAPGLPLESIDLGNGYLLIHTHSEVPDVTFRGLGYGSVDYFELKHPVSEMILAALTGMSGTDKPAVIKVGIIQQEHKAPGMAKNISEAMIQRYGTIEDNVLSFLETVWGDNEAAPSISPDDKVGSWAKIGSVLDSVKLLKKSEDLNKGVARRLMPFNPRKDVGEFERQDMKDWQSGEAQNDIRDSSEAISGNARKRALHQLHGWAETRKHPVTGEREFLLHRGVSAEERDFTNTGKSYQSHRAASWSPDVQVGLQFAGEYQNKDKSKNMASAWIPESKIKHIPGAIQPSEYSGEREVITHPGEFEYAQNPAQYVKDDNDQSGHKIKDRKFWNHLRQGTRNSVKAATLSPSEGAPMEKAVNSHENTSAQKALQDFHKRYAGIIQSIRNKEPLHPSHVANYEQARSQLAIPYNTEPKHVPPAVERESRPKPAYQPPRTIDYSAMNAVNKKPEGPSLDYTRPKHAEAERTIVYGKRGVEGVVENKPKIQKSILEKSPGLKQGSKLGSEIYDETANIGRKMTRTGQEATGAGIRAEQTYGGKAGHQTAKDTARHQEKIDAKKNKAQPVKTEMSPEVKAALEAKMNSLKKGIQQRIMRNDPQARGNHKLHGVTSARRNAQTGEREFLLHQGVDQASAEAGHTGSHFQHNGEGSWTPDKNAALDTASQMKNKNADSQRRLVSAWVPESKIKHSPDGMNVQPGAYSHAQAKELTPKPAGFDAKPIAERLAAKKQVNVNDKLAGQAQVSNYAPIKKATGTPIHPGNDPIAPQNGIDLILNGFKLNKAKWKVAGEVPLQKELGREKAVEDKAAARQQKTVVYQKENDSQQKREPEDTAAHLFKQK